MRLLAIEPLGKNSFEIQQTTYKIRMEKRQVKTRFLGQVKELILKMGMEYFFVTKLKKWIGDKVNFLDQKKIKVYC